MRSEVPLISDETATFSLSSSSFIYLFWKGLQFLMVQPNTDNQGTRTVLWTITTATAFERKRKNRSVLDGRLSRGECIWAKSCWTSPLGQGMGFAFVLCACWPPKWKTWLSGFHHDKNHLDQCCSPFLVLKEVFELQKENLQLAAVDTCLVGCRCCKCSTYTLCSVASFTTASTGLNWFELQQPFYTTTILFVTLLRETLNNLNKSIGIGLITTSVTAKNLEVTMTKQ